MEKLRDLKAALTSWRQRLSCSKRELLSLIGSLSFTLEIMTAGQTFFRRLIDLSTTRPRLYNRIKLDYGSLLDLARWDTFATPWSGHSFFLQYKEFYLIMLATAA